MKNKLIGTCPICQNKLYVSQLKCYDCGSAINGEFPLSKFDYLNEDEQTFVLIFIKNGGNIKQVEKDLNVSYPTVKKMLETIINKFGFSSSGVLNTLTRKDILAMVKNDEISFDEAVELLKEVKE